VDGAFSGIRFTETVDVRAVAVPYKGDQFAMLVLPPKADRANAFEAALSTAALDGVTTVLVEREVQLRLPKFKVIAGSS
jgi:serine protease inhibitor